MGILVSVSHQAPPCPSKKNLGQAPVSVTGTVVGVGASASAMRKDC